MDAELKTKLDEAKSNSKIYQEKNHFYVNGIEEKPIRIPSQMYPVKGFPTLFHSGTTEELEDEELKAAYDTIPFQIGKCYQNVYDMLKVFKALKIEGAEAYAGWVVPAGGGHLVHHAFVVYKKKHILDPSIDITLKDIEAFGALKNDALREALAERHIELQKLPNSERATFGRASDAYAYIASRQSPQEALKDFQKLRKTYPNHPSYRNVDQNGQNPTIKKILEKMDR